MSDRLARYLQRLGLEVPTPARPDLTLLTAVHRAHLARIPYDNLFIMLGRPDPADRDGCVGGVVAGNRLGYCFQQNAAFAWLLTELGFETSVRAGHLALPPAQGGGTAGPDHVALVVSGLSTTENPAGHWWADAGLGEAFATPLPLTPGEHHVDGWSFGISAISDGPRSNSHEGPSGWHFRHRVGGTPPAVQMTSGDHDAAAVSSAHERLSLGPGSRFRQKLVVLRNEGDRLLAVRGCVRTEVRPHGRDDRDLTTFGEWREVLADDLLLPLHDVADPELRALWARTVESHCAWDAAGRP